MKQLWNDHRTAISMIAPLALFFILDSLFSYRVAKTDENPAGIEGIWYLWLTIARVVIMLTVILFFWRSYLTKLSDRPGFAGALVGVIGAVIWIGLCELGLERWLFTQAGLESWASQRVGLDPFATYSGNMLGMFLSFRFALLVVAVPIAEELFLRGFFMRAVDAIEWQDLKIRDISFTGLAAGTAYGVLTHPSEFLAATAWFTLVTVLMVRSNSFWNCVIAHAVTNLLLGIYVCVTGSWYLW